MWSCVCMCDQVTPPICCNDGRSSIEQDTRLKHLFPEDYLKNLSFLKKVEVWLDFSSWLLRLFAAMMVDHQLSKIPD
ncbi:hypothetical protein HanIR_Chr12g0580151 [Helianthus annuus]|nr:hypothetical protein HanIR_Chr12g0580151 [Helianthus annuus]